MRVHVNNSWRESRRAHEYTKYLAACLWCISGRALAVTVLWRADSISADGQVGIERTRSYPATLVIRTENTRLR
jgi:hypothetical protein